MAQVMVISDWTATYDDPITLTKNDLVCVTGREDIWDGHRWLWAIAPCGREGWVPHTLIRKRVAREDYSAKELTCVVGDILASHQRTHGWTWCIAADGREGWVPDRCITRI